MKIAKAKCENSFSYMNKVKPFFRVGPSEKSPDIKKIRYKN